MQARISGFAREQKATRERYQAAGITDSDIEVIGIKPTNDDRDAWRRDLEHIRARERQLIAFIKSGPEYDETLLGKEQNANAGA
ncbi:hypothetical protein [Cupriavidus sp. UME77]|uniref:hypothetical protein n=1 Tax=Cupriavidus sp. UME77 TaxID=1862321 RepID=UPI0015FFE313|nr:hypothetical protein [Cupriavidus sp. UME77]MBB1636073.1 hypothetical protein [Cupriavidus sp. UME77]